MFAALLRPWRRARTWTATCAAFSSILVGGITFGIVFSLLVTSASLIIVFPLALPFAWLMFVTAKGLGAAERSRVAALLSVELGEPHGPLRPGSWWAHLKQRLGSRGRWKEIAYLLLLLPFGAVTFLAAAVAWCGSLAMIILPFVVDDLPGGTAKFWLFELSAGAGAWLALAAGVVGVVLVAPWLSLALGHLHGALAGSLLAPTADQQLRAEVTRLEASRSAAVDSAEAERRRIERDLHDGAQQRLVALAMDLGRARERFEDDPEAAKALVADAHDEAKAALADLRGLVRGLHPAILADRGLDAALSSVVARSPVPVALTVDVAERPPAAVESTAYFVVNEALANLAKHAHATKASVTIVRQGDRLVVEVTDDGVGGADPQRGSGLHGLAERVTALGGRMHVLSPAGGPTSVIVELPCAS